MAVSLPVQMRKPWRLPDEIQRVVPVVKAIRQQLGSIGKDIWLSIDTSNPAVMQAAFDAGADIWNDVRALKA